MFSFSLYVYLSVRAIAFIIIDFRNLKILTHIHAFWNHIFCYFEIPIFHPFMDEFLAKRGSKIGRWFLIRHPVFLSSDPFVTSGDENMPSKPNYPSRHFFRPLRARIGPNFRLHELFMISDKNKEFDIS